MANVIELHSLDAPELAVFARLTDRQLRSRAEPEQGVLIAESPKVIAAALDAGYQPLALLAERRRLAGSAAPLLDRLGDVPVYTGDRALLAGLTGYQLTRGRAVRPAPPAAALAEDICAGARRVAVLENIVDATNVGAIFRSAAALGVDAVLLTPGCCDPLSRRAVRVSMGTVFQVPWTRLGSRADQWPAPGMERLRNMGFATAALSLREDSLSLREPRLADIPPAGAAAGQRGRRPGPGHHCRLRLYAAHPHGPRRRLAERGGRRRGGLLAAVRAGAGGGSSSRGRVTPPGFPRGSLRTPALWMDQVSSGGWPACTGRKAQSRY